jgi:hypothetical protein
MPDIQSDRRSPPEQRHKALSRWENEGGAGPFGAQEGPLVRQAPPDTPPLTDAELLHLRVRVIALENLIIALLAEGPERQLEVAREMAAFISPRANFTPHPMTVQAAVHMVDLVNRAGHFRGDRPI